MATLSKSSLIFLKELTKNNNKEWFTEHKKRYEEANKEFKAFVSELEERLNEIDSIEKSKVFRIYRDVRFSKDKTPYKNYLSASFTREGKYRRGGFYFGFQPGNTMVGGGFWGPESKDLKFIRDGIVREEEKYRKLINSKDVKVYFGGLQGEAVKTAPKGYAKDHPAIDLIRNKQFLLRKDFTETEALKPDFAEKVVEGFKKMLPFFNFMTDVLVYDENGVERN